ncbi:MAG: glycosyltransferase family 2 protein [Colwellia sp.]|jgi:Glycosyltransferases involved in cell wall biogenesis
MKISLLVPTFNRKEQLTRLINSVIGQKHTNWEIIIVDDGSKDGTEDMVTHLNNSRLKYIRFEENRGHPEALYNADIVNKIAGDLVIFLGADDYFFDGVFEDIVSTYRSLDFNVWKLGYLWKGENRLQDKVDSFSEYQQASYFSNEIISDSYKQVDFLFVYRKCYWERFNDYFLSPDYFYSAFMDVALSHLYIEKHYPEYVVVAGWGEDNVTKGLNSEKYFRWALIYKKYILDKYADKMGPNFKRTWLLSLIRSSCMHNGHKRYALSYIRILLVDWLKDASAIVSSLSILILPPSIIFSAKKLVFKYRTKR